MMAASRLRNPRLLASGPMAQPQSALRIPLADLAATRLLARRLAVAARPGDTFALSGDLGAGKTEWARAFVRARLAEPDEEVPSPTFTLVQSYDLPAGPAHHFDLYRLDGPEGLAELGWEEAREGIVLVEWPDRLGEQAPADALRIALAPGAADQARRAVLSGWDARLARLAA